MQSGELIYRGAEADLIHGTWQGLDAVFKLRKPLPYRLEVLDSEIRKQRTVHEAQLIQEAKSAGVASPYLFSVNPEQATLVMEFVKGERLKSVVDTANEDRLKRIFTSLGTDVARLHLHGVMHGDLTTANIIDRDGELVFLDFGLALYSKRLEDHAVDLRLIKETLVGAHPKRAPAAMQHLVSGYSRKAGPKKTKEVLSQLRSIERRGRYARVD